MLKKVLLFCFVLCFPSLAFGQRFNVVSDSSLYPIAGTQATIPLDINSDQAILIYRSEPSYSVSSVRVITDAYIVPSLKLNRDFHNSVGGYYTSYGEEYSLNYYVINSSTIFTRTGSFTSSVLDSIQTILASKGLGTVDKRAALIRGFHSGPVQILDIDNFKKSILNALSPFLNVYLGIFLTLFVVDLMTRKSKDVIAESAKIQRRAERAQQRREIRADPTAQIFEFRLANFSSIASGSVSDPSISRRKARRLFEDTALEYAEYKKSRGWKY